MNRLTLALLLGLLTVACNKSNPMAPSVPTTASLHIGLDTGCYNVIRALVSVDGTEIGRVSPGDSGLTMQVQIGQHYVSALGAVINGTIDTWSPASVNVPASGFNFLLYCSGTKGYSTGEIR